MAGGCQRMGKACEGIWRRGSPLVEGWGRGRTGAVLPSNVFSEVVPASVSLAAAWALKGLLAGVQSDVPLQVAREGEGTRAEGASSAHFVGGLLLHGGVLWKRDTVSRVVQGGR